MANYPSSSNPTRAKRSTQPPEPHQPDEDIYETPESMTPEEARAVKTFSFHVSAGQKPKSNAARSLPASTPPAAKTPHPSTDRNSESVETKSAAEKESEPKPGEDITPIRPYKKQAKTTKKQKNQRLRPMSFSLVMHAIFLVCLGITSFGLPAQNQDLELLTVHPHEEEINEIEEFQDLEVDPTESLETLEPDLLSTLDTNDTSLPELTGESVLGELTEELGVEGQSLSSYGDLLADVGGLSGMGEGISGAGAVTFFGTKVEGRRILFMLDNSGSMHSGPMEQLVDELIQTVEALVEKQEFYVVFYSDTVYPLGFPQPAQNFVRANPQNKRRLQEWLSTVELCGGNAVDQAILIAEQLKPDVVFMLSDGDVRTTPSGRKYSLLVNSTGRSFKLHTLGMGCKKQEHRDQLEAIAAAHDGTFREVRLDPAMIARAQSNPRPYRNRSNPGQTWGSSFGK